jgi:hypothetical protein
MGVRNRACWRDDSVLLLVTTALTEAHSNRGHARGVLSLEHSSSQDAGGTPWQRHHAPCSLMWGQSMEMHTIVRSFRRRHQPCMPRGKVHICNTPPTCAPTPVPSRWRGWGRWLTSWVAVYSSVAPASPGRTWWALAPGRRGCCGVWTSPPSGLPLGPILRARWRPARPAAARASARW